jgi:NADH-quinone oxidoreductase subunit L
VQNDIKRVVAYSTLSQLGYMTVALGVSAYSAGVFHLMTHAFFKALLFLGAGSVIIAMHHEQDMRHMGGLRKYMPITWITMWIGSLALAGAPFFAGFFSKDAIIEAVHESHRAGAGYAYFCVLAGVFVTALYSFRLLYMTFHGKERFVVEPAKHGHGHDAHAHDDHGHHKPGHLEHAPHESPWVVTLPLILLAIPSILIGGLAIGSMLFGDFFGSAIFVREANDVVGEIGKGFHGAVAFVMHGVMAAPFWLALAGFAVATWIWLFNPAIADKAENALRPLHTLLSNKYWIDNLYQAVFARGGIRLGRGLWRVGDAGLIDGAIVNGSAGLVERISAGVRRVQSGYLYHYAFAMILGLILLLGGLWWLVVRIAA